MPKKIDLTGQAFGRLRVLREGEPKLQGNRKRCTWDCYCDPNLGGCGSYKPIASNCLTNGDTQSCGCLALERLKTDCIHGHSGGKRTEYKIWKGIKQRCTNTNNPSYHHYGGRGIIMCDRWVNGDGSLSGYECFLQDMGSRPSKEYSVHRVNNNKGYSPDNCAWATDEEQAQLTRRNVLTPEGVKQIKKARKAGASLSELIESTGLKSGAVQHVIYNKCWKNIMVDD